jgi:5-methylcytosine-specific restriction endonuclease McrA
MSKIAQEMQRLADEIFKKKTAPSREDRKEQKKTDEKAIIDAVRKEVFVLDSACICGRCRPSDKDEMHEVISRAKTRGLPPEVRFNTGNCVRLSRKCHAMVTGEVGHGKRLKLEFSDPILGANHPGRVLLTWKDGRTKTYARRVPAAVEARPE